MTWDETKQTLNDRPDIDSAEKLTSADWNDMVTDQKGHATRHEDGGVDELNVQGLSGLLADPQTPNTEDVQDIVGAFTQAATGSNISVSYDDAGDTLTIDTTALNPEETRDTVNDLLVGGTNTALTYDDVNDTLTIDVDAPTTSEFNDHSTRHESGGADEIPLNNLDLPAGAQIDEAGGDLVVRDSGGSIVLRRDEGAGTWDFVSGDLVNIASLEAETLSNDRLFAGSFDGGDADARLDNALSTATAGDRIYLENADYTASRTISKRVTFEGTLKYIDQNDGSVVLNTTWTFDDRVSITDVAFEGSDLTISGFSMVTDCWGNSNPTITVSGNGAIMSGLRAFNVTFESGTADGVIDSSVGISVTDNGANTVGDIS